jgi:DNA-binding SARP family transcriptional activator
LELATSYWKNHFDLNLIGFGTEFERFSRVTSVTELSSFLDGLHRRRLKHEILLGESGFSSFAQARYQDSSGRWDPTVVICAPTIDDQDVIELSELADPHLGLSLIACGSSAGEPHVLRLVGSEKALSVELLSSILLTQQVSSEELRGVSSLLDAASDRTPALRSDEPYASISVPTPSSSLDMSSASQAFGSRNVIEAAAFNGEIEFEVEVSVLGPIEIRGAARDFTRAWAKELVVYLAMHPGGVSNDAWATALWPDRLMAPSSLHSTASVARRSLGQDRNGLDHLPRSHSRLALANTVGTDWSKFVKHAESGDPRMWRTGLEMVRGRPFEGLRSADWPTLEGIGPAIEAAVVDLSSRFAESCLSLQDAQGATWAARKGLLVSPYDERLYRILMRAADVDGNPAGVESVMSELIKLVADDIEPFDSVHPSTMDLYRSLSRRRTAILRAD